MKLNNLFVKLFFLIVVACCSAVLPLHAQKAKQLFLLIGQSNMAGRGALDTTAQPVNTHIFKFSKENKWVPATDPLHFDKPGAGVGPGLAFAQEISKEDPDDEIGLIPCAVGGTSISKWQKEAYDTVTKTHPYEDAIQRVRLALKDGTLKGILWHQGEGDSGKDRYLQYEARFDSLYNNLKKDLGLNIDTIPFIVGELGPFYISKQPRNQGQEIDSVLHSIANKRPNMACVSAAGLQHRGDTLHFNTASARELGRRYAQAYERLRAK
ncbi:protein of unknown function [bacterium A37T11]|nr:protein of unknown function [bacterium A37T11]